MDFIKKHYEKVLLGLVLLGLAVAVALLPFYIAQEKEDLANRRNAILNPPIKPLPPLDLSGYQASFDQLQKHPELDFSKPHNLFNPVQWEKASDGHLIKVQNGDEIGPKAMTVLKLNPLYTMISFESVGASGSNYLIGVTRDADPDPRKRRKTSSYVDLGQKTDFFTLESAKGTPDDPQLNLVLNDSGKKVTISKSQTYQQVDGYSADLRYEPENRGWTARRVGDKLLFAGDEFTIASINLVATNHFEIVVSAKSTGKKTTIQYSPDL